jgi:hypothetical protein
MSKKKQNIDWEKLCSQLQEALSTEMRENQEKDFLIEEKEEAIEQLILIIHYLEGKLGIYGNQSV